MKSIKNNAFVNDKSLMRKDIIVIFSTNSVLLSIYQIKLKSVRSPFKLQSLVYTKLNTSLIHKEYIIRCLISLYYCSYLEGTADQSEVEKMQSGFRHFQILNNTCNCSKAGCSILSLLECLVQSPRNQLLLQCNMI